MGSILIAAKLGVERFYLLSYSSGPIAHARCSWPGA